MGLTSFGAECKKESLDASLQWTISRLFDRKVKHIVNNSNIGAREAEKLACS